MRYYPKPKPKIGDRYARLRFAFLPKKIDDVWIWLETYREFREYKIVRTPTSFPVLESYHETNKWVSYQLQLIGD